MLTKIAQNINSNMGEDNIETTLMTKHAQKPASWENHHQLIRKTRPNQQESTLGTFRAISSYVSSKIKLNDIGNSMFDNKLFNRKFVMEINDNKLQKNIRQEENGHWTFIDNTELDVKIT